MKRTVSLLLASAVLAGCGGGGSSSSSERAAPPAAPLTTQQRQALVASLPAPYNAGDVENGRRQFGTCRSCHTLVQGGPELVGPNLWGVFGRAAASHGGYEYSQPLRDSGIVWTPEELDRWLENPRERVPGTKMVFAGIRDPIRRRDLIAYLRAETSPAP